MATVSIPLSLSDVAGGVRRAEVEGATLLEIIAALERIHPGIEARVLSGDRLSPSITVTIDGVIASQGLSTPVGPDSEVRLLPALGGG